MQNERHLSDNELADLASGVGERQATTHLAECGDCRAELETFIALTTALREDVESQAQKPEAAWAMQRAGIRERMRGPAPTLRWAVAGLAAVIALSIGLLLLHHPAAQPAVQAQQVADQDDVLLKDIQHTLAHRAPEPLMPAAVLVEEMSSKHGQGVKEN